MTTAAYHTYTHTEIGAPVHSHRSPKSRHAFEQCAPSTVPSASAAFGTGFVWIYIYIHTVCIYMYVYIYIKEPHWNPILMRCHHCSTKTSAVNLWQQMQLVNPSGDRIEEVFHIIDPWLRQLRGGCAKGLTVTHQKRWWHGGNLSH